MNAVNPPHVLSKLDLAFRGAKKLLENDVSAVPGLRPSHYRLLDYVPIGGIRLTELAREADISKQALGEFVISLKRAGLVDVAADATDGRARLVTPTVEGRQIQDQIGRTVKAIEQDLERRVGTERWTVFCQVLDALVATPRVASPGGRMVSGDGP